MQSVAKGVIFVKRRQQINNKNLYDRLLYLNAFLIWDTDTRCVKEFLTDEYQYADDRSKRRCYIMRFEDNGEKCKHCIQQFLNEEV